MPATLRLLARMMGAGGIALPILKYNSADKTAGITLSNGDKTAQANNAGFEAVRTIATFNTTTGGKYYFETLVDAAAGADLYQGFMRLSDPLINGLSFSGLPHAVWRNSSSVGANGWNSLGAADSYGAGNVTGWAIDIPAGKVWAHKDGTYPLSGNPGTGVNPLFDSMPSATDFAFLFHTDNNAGNDQVTIIDAGSLGFSVPVGFTPIGG